MCYLFHIWQFIIVLLLAIHLLKSYNMSYFLFLIFHIYKYLTFSVSIFFN